MLNQTKIESFVPQAERILRKLSEVRANPPKHEIFGASSHKYRLCQPASESRLMATESADGFRYPDALRAFYMLVGCISIKECACLHYGPGPFYGIYAPESCYAIFDEQRSQSTLYPRMDEPAWQKLNGEMNEENVRLFSGILVFGTSGCSFHQAIVLEGQFAGRVVYIDFERSVPTFCADLNFMDWYERWLDEILAGYNLRRFGELPPGNEQEIRMLFENAMATADQETALEALHGFRKFWTLSRESITILYALQANENDTRRLLALDFLMRLEPEGSKPFILKELASSETTRTQTLVSLWFNKFILDDALIESVLGVLQNSNVPRELDLACRLLTKAKVEFSDCLIRLVQHQDAQLRRLGAFELGSVRYKRRFRGLLVAALDDADVEVAKAAMQALANLEGADLLDPLTRLARKFLADQHSVQSRMMERLEQIGPASQSLVYELTRSSDKQVVSRAYELLYAWDLPCD